MDLSIIIPAYNEHESLTTHLPNWLELIKSRGWSLIIVNDGSTDRSRELFDNLSQDGMVKVIHHKVNRGYGGALKSGMRAAKTDFCVSMDADGQHKVEALDALIMKQEEVDADLVIGKRIFLSKQSTFRRFGKAIIRLVSRILIPNQITDLNSGMKLYRTRLAQKHLKFCPDSMAFSDVITLSFLSSKHLVVETPIEIMPRTTGKSTITFNTAIETIIEIVNIVMVFNPLRIFLPVSLLLFLVGFGWGLPIVLMGRGVSVGAMLALVSGGLSLLLGLIAEQLAQIRRLFIEDEHTD